MVFPRLAAPLLLSFLVVAGCVTSPAPNDAPGLPLAGPLYPPDLERPLDAALASTGLWLPALPVEDPAIHATLLSDGRILIFAGLHAHGANFAPFLASPHNAESRVQDLSNGTGTVTVVVPTPEDGGASDLFCSDQTLLFDGRVVAFGGTRWETLPETFVYGTKDVRAWDPATNSWSQLPSMAFDRWYPSSLTVPSGNVLIASGIGKVDDPTTQVLQMELFDPATNATTVLPPSADRDLPMYPRLYVVPSGPLKGDVFFQPAGCLWCPGGVTQGEPAWNSAAAFDVATNTWRTLGMPPTGVRNAPVTVLLGLRPPEYDARILTASGTIGRTYLAVPLAEITDLSVDPPTHTLTESMAEGRWFPSHVILPDGNVLVMGGAKNDGVTVPGSDANPVSPILSTEMFTPALDGMGGTWATLAPMTIPRVYHSTALLLPDGRVWVAGSVPAQLSNPATPPTRAEAIEIFEPPYLFRGPRPLIESAPAAATWGEAMTIRTPDAETVKAVLVRAGTVTHVYNPEQRLIELVVEARGDAQIIARAPPDSAIAPPGHYMLFLMKDTDKGPVPSVASMVRLG